MSHLYFWFCIFLPRYAAGRWSPREYHAVADHAVDACLDEGKSFEIGSPSNVQQDVGQHVNLRICVDGGVRKNGSAAIA